MARRRDDDEDDLPRRRKRSDDDDEEDRPRRRDEDEEEEDRPRRRKRRDDDDEDDRPRRRRRRRSSGGGSGSGPLDGMFAGTNIAVIILFGLCCSGIAEILSIIALITGQDRDAKSNATTCLIIAIIADVVRVIIVLSRGGFR